MDELMENFDKEERSIILELARISLSDADIYNKVAEELDLSDDFLKGLQEKIESVSKEDLI